MTNWAVLGAGLTLVATQAAAIPVTLLPDSDQVVPSDDFGLEGTFVGTGFVFEAEGGSGVPFQDGGDGADLSEINDSFTGFTEQVQSLTITRADGQPFDLLSVEIPSTRSDAFAFYEGDLLDGGTLEEQITLFSEDIVGVSGVTAGGAEVSTAFDLPVPEFGSEFEDLVSLTFSVGGFPEPCAPVNLARVDPRFALSTECGGDPDTDPFSSVFIFSDSTQNDALEYTLSAISLDSPAPIPVPASLPLLAGALGALAWRTRRMR